MVESVLCCGSGAAGARGARGPTGRGAAPRGGARGGVRGRGMSAGATMLPPAAAQSYSTEGYVCNTTNNYNNNNMYILYRASWSCGFRGTVFLVHWQCYSVLHVAIKA